MKEYIERKAAMSILEGKADMAIGTPKQCFNAAAAMINLIPAADAAEVVHAEWNNDGRCTNCGGHAPFIGLDGEYYKSPYCFCCGAKMDKGET